jgi:hypothetical protein
LADVYFHNRSGLPINPDQIDTLVSEAMLPPGRVALVFDSASLPGELQGSCTPKMLSRFSPSYSRICNENVSNDWDVCVAFSKQACLQYREFPAYFSYLIGHELGHARICLSDPALHIHCCLIQEHIKTASKNKISMWHELPHELRFDQFGIYLSERLWSRSKLNEELKVLLHRPDCRDRPRLEMMLSLASRADLDQIRDELVSFSLPYKDGLIASWEKEKRERGTNSLTSLIVDYDALFK